MPGIDGLSLCHKIRPIPNSARLKCVMVSGKPRGRQAARPAVWGGSFHREALQHRDLRLPDRRGRGPRGQGRPAPSSEPVPQIQGLRRGRPADHGLGLPRPGRAQDAPFFRLRPQDLLRLINTGTASSSSTRAAASSLGRPAGLAGRASFSFSSLISSGPTPRAWRLRGRATAGYTLHISGAKEPTKACRIGHRGARGPHCRRRRVEATSAHELLERPTRSRPA